jgi:hypothetical protein
MAHSPRRNAGRVPIRRPAPSAPNDRALGCARETERLITEKVSVASAAVESARPMLCPARWLATAGERGEKSGDRIGQPGSRHATGRRARGRASANRPTQKAKSRSLGDEWAVLPLSVSPRGWTTLSWKYHLRPFQMRRNRGVPARRLQVICRRASGESCGCDVAGRVHAGSCRGFHLSHPPLSKYGQ